MTQSIKHNLVLASAALGAGAGITGVADAATFSTAPVGFGGATITQDDASIFTFDVSGNGNGVMSIEGKSPDPANQKSGKITVGGGSPGVSIGGDGSGKLRVGAFATEQTTPNGDLGVIIAEGTSSNFGTTPLFGSVSFAEGGFTQYGYFTGTFANNAFTVSDYGRAIAAVPEASTWALLTLGFGGMGAVMRRRRRAARGLAAA